MADPFYPTVDINFLLEHIAKCQLVDQASILHVGTTTTFVIKGRQALHKRFFLIRELQSGEVSAEQATGIAIRLGFLKELMEWLEKNKKWKEGGYKL
jgi:hypothetical protein